MQRFIQTGITLLLAVLLLVLPSVTWAALGIGGHTVSGFATTQTSATTGGITTTVGSGLVAILQWTTAASSFNAFTDNKGNTWTQIGTQFDDATGGQSLRVYYAQKVTAGGAGHTITLTLNSAQLITLYLLEITTTNANGITLDQNAAWKDNSASPFTSNNITTTIANEMLIAVDSDTAFTGTITHTAGASFTLLDEFTNGSAWAGATANRAVSATGTYNSSWTVTNTTSAAEFIASFSEAAAAGGVTCGNLALLGVGC